MEIQSSSPSQDKLLQKERARQELKKLVTGLVVGGIYALWFSLTRIGIPCIFHTVFHVKCPGCGMTRAAVAVLHLRFAEAYAYNHLSLTVMPVLLILLAVQEIRYIRTGVLKFTLFETIILGILCYASIFYGIFRNIY